MEHFFEENKEIKLFEENWIYTFSLLLGNWLDGVKINQLTGFIEFWIKWQKLHPILYILKLFSLIKAVQLTDIVCQDFISFKKRFNFTYILTSLTYNTKITLNFHIDDTTFIYSSQKFYASSNWLERECWDMFGVYFYGQRKLWRLLSDYGFLGFPLRKDFPMSGYLECFYDGFKKRIVRRPVELSQEYRLFTLNAVWVCLELAHLILVDDYDSVLH